MKNFLLVSFLVGLLVSGGFQETAAQEYTVYVTGATGFDSLDINFGALAQVGFYLSGGGFDKKNDLLSLAAGYFDQGGFDAYPIFAQYDREFGLFFLRAVAGGQFISYQDTEFYYNFAPAAGVKFNLAGINTVVTAEYSILQDHPDAILARVGFSF